MGLVGKSIFSRCQSAAWQPLAINDDLVRFWRSRSQQAIVVAKATDFDPFPVVVDVCMFSIDPCIR